MRILLKHELQEKVKISRSLSELSKNLGYSKSYSAAQRVKRHLTLYGIDFSHFDSFHFSKSNRSPRGFKECLICKKIFETILGNKKECRYCSHHCANTANIGKRRSPE